MTIELESTTYAGTIKIEEGVIHWQAWRSGSILMVTKINFSKTKLRPSQKRKIKKEVETTIFNYIKNDKV